MSLVTSVLIVDDEAAVRDLMARWAVSLGLHARTACDAEEALTALNAERCDLAVIDIMMPGRDGLWLAGELRRQHPHTAVVLATAYTSLLSSERAPVADLLVKPFARGRFELAVDRGGRWRKDALDDVTWHAQLMDEMRENIERICLEVPQRAADGGTEDEILTAIAHARTPDTMAHSERVQRYATSVARELGLDPAEIRLVEDAARMHDIGKLAIPESVLNKPAALSAVELAIVRRHVDTGAEILASTQSLHHLADVVLTTHEWFEGAGYPRQLKGDSIPLASRIIAVADAYDAMTQGRRYRGGLTSADAISELLRCCPSQFDPEIVAAFLDVLSRH